MELWDCRRRRLGGGCPTGRWWAGWNWVAGMGSNGIGMGLRNENSEELSDQIRRLDAVDDDQAPERRRQARKVQVEIHDVGAGADAQLPESCQRSTGLALHGTTLI